MGAQWLEEVRDKIDVDQAQSDINAYQSGTYQRWQDNKDDFYASYHMLNEHPALWLTDDHGLLQTHRGINEMAVTSLGGCKCGRHGRDAIELETGAHVLPDLDHRYFDPKLLAFGDTFEEAVIKSATCLDGRYAPSGDELPEEQQANQEDVSE